MARIVGAVATSHVPLIGKAIAGGLQAEPYWKRFFDGYRAVHEWLAVVRPDVAVLFYNDHGLNFFLDKMPTFAVGAAEFDVTTCQEMLVDHAFAIPMALLWPGSGPWPVRTVPISINTVQHPLPTATRCFKLGQAVGRALEAYDEDLKVLIVGTGGLSHQLEGTRAGFINKEFDLMCLDKLTHDPQALTGYSNAQLVELAGSQGVELLMWLAARGALHANVSTIQRHYHIPISNTAAGLLALENSA
jgi:protocatechuate 4,5-dioxygenase beta chain